MADKTNTTATNKSFSSTPNTTNTNTANTNTTNSNTANTATRATGTTNTSSIRSLQGLITPDGCDIEVVDPAEADALGGLMHLRYGANVPHNVLAPGNRFILNPGFVDEKKKAGDEKQGGEKKQGEGK